MDKPVVISGTAIQAMLFAALRVLSVLIGGGAAVIGFLGRKDLSGLVEYVRSDDFVPVAGALAAVISFVYGMWKTHQRKAALIAVEPAVSDRLMTTQPTASINPKALALLPVGLLLVGMMAACSTIGSVQLDANKAFYTAQIALRTAQQATLVTCTQPAPQLVEPCAKAIDLLHSGAKAEAAGFTAQQAGNSADLQSAVVTLVSLPSQLAALGVLEAK